MREGVPSDAHESRFMRIRRSYESRWSFVAQFLAVGTAGALASIWHRWVWAAVFLLFFALGLFSAIRWAIRWSCGGSDR